MESSYVRNQYIPVHHPSRESYQEENRTTSRTRRYVVLLEEDDLTF